MSRLIDADSYLKNFCKRFCDVKECTRTQKKSCCIAISLQEQPTAFDAEKVVERLEEIKTEKQNKYEEYLDGEDYRSVFLIESVINIVKAGRKNE